MFFSTSFTRFVRGSINDNCGTFYENGFNCDTDSIEDFVEWLLDTTFDASKLSEYLNEITIRGYSHVLQPELCIFPLLEVSELNDSRRIDLVYSSSLGLQMVYSNIEVSELGVLLSTADSLEFYLYYSDSAISIKEFIESKFKVKL